MGGGSYTLDLRVRKQIIPRLLLLKVCCKINAGVHVRESLTDTISYTVCLT